MLDIPCGRGELIATLRSFFPQADIRGCDLRKPEGLSSASFCVADASSPFTVFSDIKFDYIFSVMEFENTLQFCERCRAHLRKGGQFIVTNDNIVSMRDRIEYFLLGKFRPFKLFVTQAAGTWKVIPIQNLVRILKDAGFRIRRIIYLSVTPSDWLTLPFARRRISEKRCLILPA